MTKGITSKICWFCLVLINSVLLKLSRVWILENEGFLSLSPLTDPTGMVSVYVPPEPQYMDAALCVRPAETRITKVDQADNRSRNSFSKFDINSMLHLKKKL